MTVVSSDLRKARKGVLRLRRTVCDEATEISAHDAMPGGSELDVKFFLDRHGNILSKAPSKLASLKNDVPALELVARESNR